MQKAQYTREDLKVMQGWSFERKIQVAQLRIDEWYEHFGGGCILVSLVEKIPLCC